MRTMVAAIALAGAVWGCDAKASSEGTPPAAAQEKKAEGPTYTATVKIDDV